VVREAVARLDDPDDEAVADYAADRGVPREAARDLLGRLHGRGEVRRVDGGYRPV
jgi:predicted transcriptional regulator of viral defense system